VPTLAVAALNFVRRFLRRRWLATIITADRQSAIAAVDVDADVRRLKSAGGQPVTDTCRVR
jgi:hypothetical protein